MHDRLEQRGPSLLHGFFEGEGAGDLEGHVGRVDVVVFAVVENGAEIDDREAGQVTARGGLANSSFDGGNPVLGDGAAENVVDEFNSFATLDGFHFNAA